MPTPHLYHGSGNGTRAKTREYSKVKATQRIKTPLVENQLDTIIIRQIRTVKKAPKYESKVQQVLLLEVAMKGERE